MNATLADLDLRGRRLYVTEKGNKSQMLYLSQATVTAIRVWLKTRRQMKLRDDLLFTGKRGTGLTREGVERALSRIASRAGVRDNTNPHAWRHAFARDTLRAGANLADVAQLMGHSGVGVTADYHAQWDDRELQQLHGKYGPLAKRKGYGK